MKLYPALDIHFSPEAERAVELRDHLAAGLDDFQPTAIEESASSWRVFFDAPERRERALAWVRSLRDRRLTPEALDVEDEDWARRSQSDLQPVRIGNIVVSPPWAAEQARADAAPDADVIVVVPSTGFGTGHHASTRLCLTLLQETAVRGRSVLDIGTGSGVLAIAAARLGARSVIAVDNDPDALEAARENVALNGVNASVAIHGADFRAIARTRADIILANLTGDLLRRSAADLAECANRPGELVLSGVLAEEQSAVVLAFEAAGARLATARADEEWVGLRFALQDVTVSRQTDCCLLRVPNTADEWIERLQLQEHPEGGWFREAYRSSETLPASALPPRFGVAHPFSTSIHFLLRGDEFSALHRLKADEVWHYYAGSPLTLHLIAPDGTRRCITIGGTPPLFQAVVPARHWFGATVEGGPQSFALVGCTVAPGFIFDDFELGDRAQLLAEFPQHRALIERLTRG